MAKTQPKDEPMKDVKPRRANYAELGGSGLQQWGGIVHEELLRELQGQRAMKIYREMRENDPVVGAFLFAVEQVMRQVDWKVVAADDTEQAKKIAEFVDECRTDMSITWSDVISEILTMLTFGWSWLEIVYKRRGGESKDPTQNSKYTDGKIGWRKLPLRGQESFDHWEFAPGTTNLRGLWQRTNELGLVYIPIERGLLFRTRVEKNNPEGRSILRNAYRPWYFKKRIEEVEGIGIERDLAGLPVLTSPEGLDLWNENDPVMKKMLDSSNTLIRNIRRDEQEGVLLPFGWTLELLSTGGRRAFDTTEIINRYDQRITMTCLADFILLGQNKYGSFALAKSKNSTFLTSIIGYLNSIRDVFNLYALPRLCSMNGIDPLMVPKLDYSAIDAPNLREFAGYLTALNGLGLQFDESALKYILQVGGIPVDRTDLAGDGGTGQGTRQLTPEEKDPRWNQVDTAPASGAAGAKKPSKKPTIGGKKPTPKK